jgi:CheY-like chemotaxis protein
MNGIIGLLEQTERMEKTPKMEKSLKTVLGTSKQLHTLLNDLLDISKIESAKLTVNIRPFKITEIVDNVLELFQEKARVKGIQVQKEICNNLPEELLGDPDRITQILSNLISNSIKFTDSGHIIVKVDQLPIDIDTTKIIVTLEDSGCGISLEEQDGLFKEYFQTRRSAQYGGTGLGLAVSKKLAVLMGGSLDYKPAVPRGSIFWFSLPLRIPLTALDVQHSTKMPPKESTWKNLRVAGKILVVEDAVLNQKVISKHLRNFGCEVDAAYNGEEAQDLVKENMYSLILMDIHMPIKDGIQATKEIREKNISTPIVALTAGTSENQKTECFRAGMNDFLSKPVYREELACVLLKYLHNQEK